MTSAARRAARGASAAIDLERDVRDGDLRVGGSSPASASASRDLDVDAVRGGVRASSPRRRRGSSSTATTGAKPSFAAAIASTPEPQPTSSRLPRGSSSEQLEAEPRRRMRAGPERAARVDDDRGRAVRRLLPRRADPERPDPDAAGGTRASAPPSPRRPRLDGDAAERGSQPRARPPRRCTRRARRRPPASRSSKPSGKSSSMSGARLLGALARDDDGDARSSAERAPQPLEEARRRRSYVSSPCSLARTPRAARAARRSGGAGRATLTSTRWSPRPKPCEHGHALARAGRAPRRAASRARSSSSARRRASATVTVAPSAAWVIVRSTAEKMSLPSRTKRGSGRTWTST